MRCDIFLLGTPPAPPPHTLLVQLPLVFSYNDFFAHNSKKIQFSKNTIIKKKSTKAVAGDCFAGIQVKNIPLRSCPCQLPPPTASTWSTPTAVSGAFRGAEGTPPGRGGKGREGGSSVLRSVSPEWAFGSDRSPVKKLLKIPFLLWSLFFLFSGPPHDFYSYLVWGVFHPRGLFPTPGTRFPLMSTPFEFTKAGLGRGSGMGMCPTN